MKRPYSIIIIAVLIYAAAMLLMYADHQFGIREYKKHHPDSATSRQAGGKKVAPDTTVQKIRDAALMGSDSIK